MATNVAKSQAETGSRPPPFIHIVDDDEQVLELVAACMHNSGYATQAFKNPLEAYSAFVAVQPKPSLLIVDYSMPEMHGLELLRRYRTVSPGMKGICITGVLTMEKLRDFDVQPELMLRKPFSYRELVDGVREVLAR